MGAPNVVGDDVYAIEDFATEAEAMRSMLRTIEHDRREYKLIKDYFHGNHVLPNVPKTARVEVHEIAKRSTMNLIPLLVGIPAQISFIDGYRVGEDLAPPEWKVWTNSSMASKQTAAFRTALKYGNAFLALEDAHTEKPQIKLLSTSDTVAYYHDPVNDRFPVYAMTIRYRPSLDNPGLVVFYDEEAVTYFDWHQGAESGDSEFRNPQRREHGLPHTPVGRLVCQMDDDGQVEGVVKPMIPMQDRINQTAFDLLVTQTFSSFKVRWASGMLGDPLYEEDGITPKVDADGNQIYRPLPIDQSTWITTDDSSAKLGTLDETPLDGFIQSFELAVKHFSVVGQLPPHNLLGPMQNISADTLVAAMSQTMRFAHMLKTGWASTISDLLGLASISMGIRENLEDYEGEVRWRDMSDHTLAAVVDALGKAAQMLDVPKKSLWHRYPGVTPGEVQEWHEAYDEQKLDEMDDLDTPQGAGVRSRANPAQAQVDNPPPTPLEAFGAPAAV